MAWIDTRAGEEPEPRLRELYERVRDPVSGQLDHIMQIHALHPRGLAAHFELYTAVMRPSPTLGKAEREMVALVVSTINECHYWIAHHRRGLRRLLEDDALLDRIEADYESAGLSERQVAMLRYADKLTRAPRAMERGDVEALRAVGFSDRDVLHIAEVVGYYAYVNRIADGLGVELE